MTISNAIVVLDEMQNLTFHELDSIITRVGDTALGKGNFTLVREQFTSNASGLISVWMWACTSEDAYIDNVKIYPAE